MEETPSQKNARLRLIRDALARGADAGATPLRDEDLILLAEGRLDEVDASRRDALLQAVACDSTLSAAVAEFSAMVYPHGLETETEPLAKIGPVGSASRFAMHNGWKIAAMVALAFGAWRLADPPGAVPDNTVVIRDMHVPGDEPGGSGVWRDVALGASVALTAGLFAAHLLRKRRRDT